MICKIITITINSVLAFTDEIITICSIKHGSIQICRLVRLCSRLTNSDHTSSLIQSYVVAADEVAWVDVGITDVVAIHILEIDVIISIHVVGRDEISLCNLHICIEEWIATTS